MGFPRLRQTYVLPDDKWGNRRNSARHEAPAFLPQPVIRRSNENHGTVQSHEEISQLSATSCSVFPVEHAFRPEEEGRGLVLQSGSQETFLHVLSPIRDAVALANLHLPPREGRTHAFAAPLIDVRFLTHGDQVGMRLCAANCARRPSHRHRSAFLREAVVGKSTTSMELLRNAFGATTKEGQLRCVPVHQ